jgi:hypothetical protein
VIKGNAFVGFQLLVNLGEIGLCFDRMTAHVCRLHRRSREQQPLQLCVIQGLRHWPTQVGGRSPFQVSLHGTPADPASVSDLSFALVNYLRQPSLACSFVHSVLYRATIPLTESTVPLMPVKWTHIPPESVAHLLAELVAHCSPESAAHFDRNTHPFAVSNHKAIETYIPLLRWGQKLLSISR